MLRKKKVAGKIKRDSQPSQRIKVTGGGFKADGTPDKTLTLEFQPWEINKHLGWLQRAMKVHDGLTKGLAVNYRIGLKKNKHGEVQFVASTCAPKKNPPQEKENK